MIGVGGANGSDGAEPSHSTSRLKFDWAPPAPANTGTSPPVLPTLRPPQQQRRCSKRHKGADGQERYVACQEPERCIGQIHQAEGAAEVREWEGFREVLNTFGHLLQGGKRAGKGDDWNEKENGKLDGL